MASRESIFPWSLPPFPRARVALPRWVALALVLAAAVVGGVLLGHTLTGHSPLLAAMALVAAPVAVLVLSDVRAGIWATLGVVALFPFAVIPVHLGLTPTLFESAALATIAVWLVTLLLGRDGDLRGGTAGAAFWLFLAMTLFALILGVGRGYTMETVHDYAKFALAIVFGYVVWNATRKADDVRRVLGVLLGAGGVAAALGLVLYAGGASLTLRVLSRLIPYGYPSDRIVRWVEDNPAGHMRLTSTSVDPNSFGGFLAVIAVLALAQAIARDRLLPRRLTVTVAGLALLAVLLTFSRGAWVGVAAGGGLLALLRYRWLLIPAIVGAIPVAALGVGASFVHRFWLGITLQDPATRLRLREYQNALAIIRSHPIFGVGFGSAGSIDQQTGVSSVYLSIAERAGLVGLAVFLLAMLVIARQGYRRWQEEPDSARGELLLGLLAALASALTVGIFDHYFFNITFPHMAALFWTICGLILAVAELPAVAPAGLVGGKVEG